MQRSSSSGGRASGIVVRAALIAGACSCLLAGFIGVPAPLRSRQLTTCDRPCHTPWGGCSTQPRNPWWRVFEGLWKGVGVVSACRTMMTRRSRASETECSTTTVWKEWMRCQPAAAAAAVARFGSALRCCCWVTPEHLSCLHQRTVRRERGRGQARSWLKELRPRSASKTTRPQREGGCTPNQRCLAPCLLPHSTRHKHHLETSSPCPPPSLNKRHRLPRPHQLAPTAHATTTTHPAPYTRCSSCGTTRPAAAGGLLGAAAAALAGSSSSGHSAWRSRESPPAHSAHMWLPGRRATVSGERQAVCAVRLARTIAHAHNHCAQCKTPACVRCVRN